MWHERARKKSWTKKELENAVHTSKSIRAVIKKVGLIPAGGNYTQIKKYIDLYQLDTSHFTGKGWSKGMCGIGKPRIPLEQILVKNNYFQSYKLKKRLFQEGLKNQLCELCGWAEYSKDGRIPLELDILMGTVLTTE